MFSAWLGMVVSRPGWSLCFLIGLISVKGFPYFVGVLERVLARRACFVGITFSAHVGGGAVGERRRCPGLHLICAWLVPDRRYCRVGDRWISFIRGPRPGGGVPGRLTYHLVGRR